MRNAIVVDGVRWMNKLQARNNLSWRSRLNRAIDNSNISFSILLWILFAAANSSPLKADEAEKGAGVRLSTFDIDATPPIGARMAYDPVKKHDELGLRCRGIVLLGAGEPIVLCAIDWIGIANQSHDIFREHIATAAGTSTSRVAVHTLHQHDAPRSDFGAESLLQQVGAPNLGAHDGGFTREVVGRLSFAIQSCLSKAVPISHAAFGTAVIKEIASNRRIQDESGKVIATRYTATKDAQLRALPDGVIDPELSSLSFWNGDTPVAVLSYYACHPQSYYRTGIPSPDFPGIARFIQSQSVPGPLHIHFNGAGGNIGAGKYNDGSPESRIRLAEKLATGMREALERSVKFEINSQNIDWKSVGVSLPVAKHLNKNKLHESLQNWDGVSYWGAADKLAWVLRCESGHKIELGCLAVGTSRIVHMPGELFVEYQLAAKKMRPDLKIAMAAYGDYGPGYIGTSIAYSQGGYEVSEPASNVAPEVEEVLLNGMKELLNVQDSK